LASWSQLRAGAFCTIRLCSRRDDLLRLNMFETAFRRGRPPAWTAQIVCSVWWKLGVAIETASIVLSSSSAGGQRKWPAAFCRSFDGLDAAVDDRLIDVAARHLDVKHLEYAPMCALPRPLNRRRRPDGVVRLWIALALRLLATRRNSRNAVYRRWSSRTSDLIRTWTGEHFAVGEYTPGRCENGC
jgi:hypothetical protein